jgi:outer membrane lipoprotein-sorting protein
MYAALKTYSDTGAVDHEFGTTSPLSHEHHTFKTYYRAPRSFFFDFTKVGNIDRHVVWSDEQAFYTWWRATGATQSYPKGQGSSAFVTGAAHSVGSILVISPWLFSQAGLTGALTEFGDATLAGTETINGRPCHKLTGTGKSVYGATGHVSNVRAMTVWIDVDTLLVRRVLEDPTPPGEKVVSRTTTSFEPQANPTLDDAVFKFTPPIK